MTLPYAVRVREKAKRPTKEWLLYATGLIGVQAAMDKWGYAPSRRPPVKAGPPPGRNTHCWWVRRNPEART